MWLTVVLLSTVFLFVWWELRNVYKTFERLGIKGPKPIFLLGNLLQIYRRPAGKTREQVFSDWVSEFGRVFGYFEGIFPVLFVANPDTLQKILQTDFNNFVNRPARDDFDGGTRGDVFSSRGQRWKRIRSVVSPVFSPANMRGVAPVVDEKVELFVNKLQEKAMEGKGFDIYHLFQCLTLDIIGQTAFAMNIDSIADDSHPFAYHCREVFVRIAKAELPFQLIRGFPVTVRVKLQRLLAIAGKYLFKRSDSMQHFKYLMDAAKHVVDERRENPVFFSDKPDLLGLMLNYAEDVETIPETKDHFKGNFKKTMTLKEVQMNCWLFLLAGFETSSTALGFMAHALCQHQEIQERLFQEIHQHEERINNDQDVGGSIDGNIDNGADDSKISENNVDNVDNAGRIDAGTDAFDKIDAYGSSGADVTDINGNSTSSGREPSYETILKMTYLDQVIQESLRLYPPAPLVIRRNTAEEIQIKLPEGSAKLPKGLTLQIGVLATHLSPAFWTNPTKFDPDRFSPENRKLLHPFQFLPFGLGPRGCVGMRFAMMEIKMALVRLVKRFRIEPCAETVPDVEFVEGATRTPKGGVFVKLTSRA